MGLIREPKDVDFVVKSKPWTDEELIEFRVLMMKIKAKGKAKRSCGEKNTKNYA